MLCLDLESRESQVARLRVSLQASWRFGRETDSRRTVLSQISATRLKRLLPGYRLREDLHARSIAGVAPGGMHNTVGSGN